MWSNKTQLWHQQLLLWYQMRPTWPCMDQWGRKLSTAYLKHMNCFVMIIVLSLTMWKPQQEAQSMHLQSLHSSKPKTGGRHIQLWIHSTQDRNVGRGPENPHQFTPQQEIYLSNIGNAEQVPLSASLGTHWFATVWRIHSRWTHASWIPHWHHWMFLCWCMCCHCCHQIGWHLDCPTQLFWSDCDSFNPCWPCWK